MADYPALASALAARPAAGRSGHFLPYLLGQRLRAVAWPADGGTRAVHLLLLALVLLYGAGLGVLLNKSQTSAKLADLLPKLLAGLNAGFLFSALLVDFLPALRPVTRPVPEHFPVSARLSVVTAFLLDAITLRRLLMVAPLLVTMLVAPRHMLLPGFTLLLVLAAAALSFNLRLLVALRRGRHPLLLLHLASLGLMGWWLSHPGASSYSYAALGWGMALLPWLLWAAQLSWLGPYFSARYLPADTGAPTAAGQVLARLSPEWKMYLRKAWLPLLMGLVLKILFIVASLWLQKSGKESGVRLNFVLYIAFLPVIGFTYVNNNFFGFLGPLTANELQRLGLTPRLLRLYVRLVGPVVLADCLVSAVLLLALYPRAQWPLLGLLPLGAAAFASLGLWGSLYHAKAVVKAIDFANMRNNVSNMMSLLTTLLAAALFFMPWWWARIGLAALVTAVAIGPVRAVLRNDGPLRRRLWRDISR